MLDKVKETILAYGLLDRQEKILTALSGGPDSVFLLHILKRLASEYNFTLSAAHINHGLRGAESDRDEKFCIRLCKKLKVPLFTEKICIAKKKGKSSIEELARNERYRVLLDIAKKTSVSKIAMGHSADDQVETVIMRFVRGGGIKGLSGIPPKRKIEGSNVWIIRPMLGIWKEEVLKYLKERKIPFVNDSSNKKPDFFRNRVRHELLPLLSKYNRNIKKTISFTGCNMAMADDYLTKVVEEKFGQIVSILGNSACISRKKLMGEHPFMAQMIVRKIVREIEPLVNLEARNVQKVLALAGNNRGGEKSLDLPRGVSVRKEGEALIFCKN